MTMTVEVEYEFEHVVFAVPIPPQQMLDTDVAYVNKHPSAILKMPHAKWTVTGEILP
jgi:hypothetical protein